MICSSEIENTRPVCVLPIKCSTLKTIDRYNWYLIRILVYIGFVGAIRLFYLSGSALNARYSLNNLNIFAAGYFETVFFTVCVVIDLMKYIEYIIYAYYSIIKHIPKFECIKDVETK